MKSIKAKAIFSEDERDFAEAYLEDIQIYHPRMKMIKLSKSGDKHNKWSYKDGGFAIASRIGMFYETKWKTGIHSVDQ